MEVESIKYELPPRRTGKITINSESASLFIARLHLDLGVSGP